jgi:hypothetical protein
MNRSDFLRTTLLAPVAAFFGLKWKPEPVHPDPVLSGISASFTATPGVIRVPADGPVAMGDLVVMNRGWESDAVRRAEDVSMDPLIGRVLSEADEDGRVLVSLFGHKGFIS